MIYLFIDTNVYIRILTEEKLHTFLEDIKLLARSKLVKLIVPEVVILEMIKQNKSAIREFNNTYNKLKKDLNKSKNDIWSEVRNSIDEICKTVENEKSKKIKLWNSNYDRLISFLESDDVDFVEFTPQIICNGHKRIISGGLPRSTSVDQDAFNIESVISFMSNVDAHIDYELIVCTNDLKDYTSKEKSSLNRDFYEVHSTLKDDFKSTICTSSLPLVMKYINFDYSGIEEQCDAYEEITQLTIKGDIEDVEYDRKFNALTAKLNRETREIYELKLDTSPNELIKHRQILLGNIEELLNKGRSLDSWSDKSELNLFKWLGNREEEKIYTSKLSDLLCIESSLQEYVQIHQDEI